MSVSACQFSSILSIYLTDVAFVSAVSVSVLQATEDGMSQDGGDDDGSDEFDRGESAARKEEDDFQVCVRVCVCGCMRLCMCVGFVWVYMRVCVRRSHFARSRHPYVRCVYAATITTPIFSMCLRWALKQQAREGGGYSVLTQNLVLFCPVFIPFSSFVVLSVLFLPERTGCPYSRECGGSQV